MRALRRSVENFDELLQMVTTKENRVMKNAILAHKKLVMLHYLASGDGFQTLPTIVLYSGKHPFKLSTRGCVGCDHLC